ncbi:hypothetical protein EW145_g3380 [Phellinidium pouzarii]|uniref:Uncharacterized protein n=1 Tax=Phellinidium pouzarii TaxID=167371 RepID=A0A4S4L7V5_9AGAM|nr:hypothetical protein EW145_g3380 [Phellinidium pouzarii]
MSSFLPSSASPRASPKRRLENGIPNLSSLDITVSSATSSASAALSGLSSKDVQLIDEIIERSPPSATTFLTVFKAYNEVLHERGMDAANDVVYYKILLKLGVVKGHDWGSKWETVKVQLGYGEGGDEDEENGYSDSVDSEKETTQIPKGTRAVGRAARGGTRVERSEPRKPLPPLAHLRFHHTRSLLSEPSSFAFGRESVTVHSHLDDGTETQTDTTEQQETIDGSQSSSSPTTLIPREKAGYSKENALHLSTEATTYPPLPTIDQFLPVQAKKKQFNYDVISNFTNHPRTRSSTPPPFEALSAMKKPVLHVRHDTPFTHPYIPPAKIVDKQSPPKDNSLNEEETWKRVRMCRDEKEADRFREVLLLERCWQVWKGGLQWLISMGEKVDTEREKNAYALASSKVEVSP